MHGFHEEHPSRSWLKRLFDLSLLPTEVEINSGHAVAIERIPGYAEHHRVRPGLTGIAQFYAPRDIPRRQKFRYDQLYIQNGSQGSCLIYKQYFASGQN